jgi:hypothetical protein
VELGKVGYLTPLDLVRIMNEAHPMPKIRKHWEEEEIEDAEN